MFGRKLIFFILVLTNASIVYAKGNYFRNFDFSNVHPYVGLGFQNRSMKITGSSIKIFAKNRLETNINFGLKFHKYFGVELGYSQSKARSSDNKLDSGDTFLGRRVNNNQTVIRTRMQLKDWNFNLLGFFPLENFVQNFSLVGGIGFSKVIVNLQYTPISNYRGLVLNRYIIKLSEKRKKYVLRLIGGAQYHVTNNIGIRGLLTYENTSKIAPQTIENGLLFKAKLKDSFIYGLSLFYKFW